MGTRVKRKSEPNDSPLFPEGHEFCQRHQKQVQRVEDWINNYPRKVLGYLTAEILYNECVAALPKN